MSTHSNSETRRPNASLGEHTPETLLNPMIMVAVANLRSKQKILCNLRYTIPASSSSSSSSSSFADQSWTVMQVRCFKGMPGPRSCRRKMILEKMQRRNNVQSFQNLIQSQKALQRVLILKKVLASHPFPSMEASELGRDVDSNGFMMQRKAVHLLGKYPSIFKISNNPLWERPFVQFTDEAKALVDEEKEVMNAYKPILAEKVAKLLMMCVDKRLALDHLCLLNRELWLPVDFRSKFIHEYPQFFKVVEREGIPYVELTEWDDSLAMTMRELDLQENPLHSKTGKKIPFGFQLHYAHGHRPGLNQRQEMNKWQELPFISPYENPEGTNPMSLQYGKRAVAVLHEFLSLTLEKMSSVEVLDVVRKQLLLPCRLLYFVHKHYAIFYVAEKGNMHPVFLKEAYRAMDHPKKVAHLIKKAPQLEINEKFKQLMLPHVAAKIPGLARRE